MLELAVISLYIIVQVRASGSGLGISSSGNIAGIEPVVVS